MQKYTVGATRSIKTTTELSFIVPALHGSLKCPDNALRVHSKRKSHLKPLWRQSVRSGTLKLNNSCVVWSHVMAFLVLRLHWRAINTWICEVQLPCSEAYGAGCTCQLFASELNIRTKNRCHALWQTIQAQCVCVRLRSLYLQYVHETNFECRYNLHHFSGIFSNSFLIYCFPLLWITGEYFNY